MRKMFLEGTKIEDVRGLTIGRLTIIDFDWDRYNTDIIRKQFGEIKQLQKHWVCLCSCGNTKSIRYSHIKDGSVKSCGCYNSEIATIRNSKVKTVSFEQWCLDNNHQDYLDLWDYELNDRMPNEVPYHSNRKYMFRCPNNTHKSELWCINDVTNITKNKNAHSTISCRMCNSFGQYLLNTYGNNGIDTYWSKQNATSPFDIQACSGKKVFLICRDCNTEKHIACSTFITHGIGCTVCGDGISYPNKFMVGLLKQICVGFKTEKTFKWSNKKRYDVYIGELGCIIENNGRQHYDGGFDRICGHGRTLEEEQENDKLKRGLALSNGIKHYIELDCRKSELEWIKQSIMNSELPNLLNFKEDDIDWIECGRYATKNIEKEVCMEWNTGRYNTTRLIAEQFGIHVCTVIKYLKNGTKIGWCIYNTSKSTYNKLNKEKK